MSARRNPDAALLSAYLEGEVTASERASIEAELNESAEARRTLAQLRDVRALLSAPEAELESMDLPSRVRAAVRQPAAGPATLSSGRRARSMMPLWLGGVAASAALVALFAFSSKQEGNDAEFRAKGSELRVSEGSRWAGIQIYRVGAGGRPERLASRMRANDGLAFSYTNVGPRPFRYLMIFAVDSKNQVRWFYPAYEMAGTNPESIAIEQGRADVALGELLEHDFADGTLSLYSLFTNAPANVLAIETWVSERGRPGEQSPIEGGLLKRMDIQVER